MAKGKKDKQSFIRFVSRLWKAGTDESPDRGSRHAVQSQASAPLVADGTPASAHNILRALETANAPTRSSGSIPAVHVGRQPSRSAADNASSFDEGRPPFDSTETAGDGPKPAVDGPSSYQHHASTGSETPTFGWVTSDSNNLSHIKQIGAGGAGEVHEVLPPTINTANFQICDKNDARVSALELFAFRSLIVAFRQENCSHIWPGDDRGS